MAESQTLTVIRLWAAIAWADGKIAEREKESLRRLIGVAGLSDVEAMHAEALLRERAELPAEVAELTDDAKKGIYRAACRIAMVDDELADAERTLLDQLRDKLALSPEAAKQIEYAVPGLS
jgi:uncharacterized membrane protein YebE (DUF533 family)